MKNHEYLITYIRRIKDDEMGQEVKGRAIVTAPNANVAWDILKSEISYSIFLVDIKKI